MSAIRRRPAGDATMRAMREQDETGLRVADTDSKGRGVYAERAFAAGELVTEAPVIVIPSREWKAIEPTVIGDYCFAWGRQDRDAALVLGIGSLFNHATDPNCEPVRVEDDELMQFVATRDIAPGEELTISYRDARTDPRPLWFEPA